MDIIYPVDVELIKYSIEIEDNDYISKGDRIITDCGTIMMLVENDKIIIPYGFGVLIPRMKGKVRYHSRYGDSYWMKRFGQHARWFNYKLHKI